ncbi:MAG: type II toxin-antitoxin system HipA family toxin [Bacteroidales bacterium]|nr:type II toxin-antitoxin system HipA family toxin [Bacteroidales bacterium]
MIRKIQSVNVLYHGKKVGTLSCSKRGVCSFEYDKEWLITGFSISPLKLPLKSGIFTADYQPFYGNFGVFEDSLPGGYGEYLLRKVLDKQGTDYRSLTPVQKLSLVGNSGMGALCYEPETKVIKEDFNGTFDQMQQMINDVLSEKSDKDADRLFFKSGNSGGARPKCLYSDSDGHWIVKFRHIYDKKNIGEIEYNYNLAARKCGIEVPDFKLFDGKYFGVKRFDISENGEKLHVVTASGILHEPITPPKMDYHSLLQLTGYLTQSPQEVEQQFRRMVFNVYAKNFDDHARNFSFIFSGGRWRLSPAYDLTNDDTLGEHATTVNFNGLPTDEDMIFVGKNIKITEKRCKEIMAEVKTGILHSDLDD